MAKKYNEEEIKASGHHPADTNGDGKVSMEEFYNVLASS